MVFGFRLLIICCLVSQLVLDNSLDNVFLTFVLSTVCLVAIEYYRVRASNLVSVVPTLMMVFFALEFAFLPLVLKTLDWQALVERLNYVPVTAAVVCLTGISIILGGTILDYFQRGSLKGSFAYKFGFLESLSFRHCMAMGGFSLILWLPTIVIGGFLSKVLFPVSIFILIPFTSLANTQEFYKSKAKLLYLILYFLILLILSAAFNARGVAAEAVVVAITSWLIGRTKSSKSLNIFNLLVLLSLGVILFLFFERFVLAMGIAREARGAVSMVDMVNSTLSILVDIDRLAEYRAFGLDRVMYGGYSEDYVDSTLLSRFVGIKFLDNFLLYASLLPDGSVSLLADERLNSLARLLPSPIASFFGVLVDKNNIFSFGDYLYYLYSGVGLGELKTGSLIGDLWLIAGWLFYLPLTVLIVVLFCLTLSALLEDPGVSVSPVLLVLSWKLFGTTAAVGFAGDSVVSLLSFLLRNYWQYLFAYLVVKYLSRVIFDRWISSITDARG